MIPISEKLPIRTSEKSESKMPKEGHFKAVYKGVLKKTEEDSEKEGLPSPLALMQPLPTPPSAFSFVEAVQGASFHQALEVFETMVSAMTSLHIKGDQETTFFIDAPESLFSGTQIVIKEFSTAPKSFNIEFIGSPRAVELFQSSMQGFIAAFHAETHAFKINRLDAHLVNKERPLVHRKESLSEDQRGQDETL